MSVAAANFVFGATPSFTTNNDVMAQRVMQALSNTSKPYTMQFAGGSFTFTWD